MPRHDPAATGGTVVLEAPPAAPAALATPANTAPVATAKMAAPPGALRKVSFGAIAARKDDTKTAYPVFPADPVVAEIVARILYRTELFEALKGALETDKAELKFKVAPFYFTANHKRHEVPSSVSVAAAPSSRTWIWRATRSCAKHPAPKRSSPSRTVTRYSRMNPACCPCWGWP